MYLINDDTENTSDKQPLIDFTSSPTLTTASTDTPTTPPTTSPSTAEKPNTFARLAAFSKELEKDNDDNDDDDNDDDNDDNNNNNSSNTNEDYNEGDNNSSNSNDDGKTRIKKSHIRAYHKIMKAMKKTKGAAVESGLDVGLPYGEVQMHGFLYKKSRWYTKINISSQIWQKRWFVLSDTFWYCRNPLSPEKNRREIPLWKVWKVEASPDDACNILLYTKKQTYILRAVSADVAAKWTEALRERIEAVRDALPQYYSDSGLVDVDEDGDDDYVSTLEYPFGESTGHIVFWALTYPLALLFALTIPDTRKDKCKKMFVLSFIMVSIWIGGMSYAMVWAADRFAHVFHIPDDLMGLTITAFGSSLPSLFGSVVAAKQGSPDMAIANAFGSSLTALFSIGLPCFIYSVIHKGGPYFCESGAILITNFILIGSLIFFLIFAGISKLKLNYIHGVIFTVAYFVFMAFIVIIERPWKSQD